VQTEEGESISQLIAGYIDIIIKKKKEADRMPDYDDTEVAHTEDSVNVAQASAINIIPGRAGMAQMVDVAQTGMVLNGSGGNAQGAFSKLQQMQFLNMPGGLYGGVHGDQGAQQALLQNINNGFAAVNTATSDLNLATQLPPLGNDPASAAWRQQTLDVNKTNVQSQVAAHLAATAATVTLTGVDPDKMDFTAIGANISTISSNLTSLASGTKMIAALMLDPTDGEKLLEAARNLAAATSKLLQSVQPAILGQGNRQDLLSAAQAIGSASSQLMSRMGNPDVSAATQQELLELAKAVANATTALVAAAKNVAAKTDDPNAQQLIVTAARDCGSSATQLYASTAAVAPCINSQICQDQLAESTVAVENAVGALLQRGTACKDGQAIGDLSSSAQKVREAIAALLDFARRGGHTDTGNDIDRHADLVLASCANMLDAMGDSAGIVSAAKSLAMGSTALVNLLKGMAGSDISPDERSRLMAAVRSLADATSKMVAVAKEAARYPDDPARQAALRQAVDELQKAALLAAGADNKAKAFKRLMNASKAVAASSTQLISAAKSAAPSNRNQASQLQLSQAARKVGEATANLVAGIRAYGSNPDDASAQLKLINAAKQAISPGQGLVAAGKAAAPTTADAAAQSQLLNFAKQNAEDLRKLQETFTFAENVSGDLEMDSALDTIKAVKQDLTNAKDLARKGQLQPSSEHTAETAQLDIAAQSRSIGSSLAQLLSAANQGNENYSGVASRDAAASTQALGGAVRGLAGASQNDKELQDAVLTAGTDVAQKVGDMIAAAKKVLTNKDAASKDALQAASKAASDALVRIVDALPGQRDVEKAIKSILARAEALETDLSKRRADVGENFNSAQNKLNTAAAALSMASNNLVAASKGTPAELKKAAAEYDAAFARVVDAAGALYALTDDPALKANIVNYVRSLAASSSKLLAASKAVSADPNGPNLKNMLTAAARNVSDALSQMLLLCSATSAPGQKECDAAKQSLEFAAQRIQNVNDPSLDNEDSYIQSLNKVLEATKVVTGQIANLSTASRSGDGPKIGSLVKEAAQQVANITDSAARSAYLIAVSDPSSSPGMPGLVDQDKFAHALHEIKEACDKLVDPANKEPQILAAAQVIAKYTQALCGACKVASQKTSNPVATQQFVASAKTVASFTTDLVASIKALATNPSPAARNACAKASAPLIDAVESLVTFSSSPEFAASPAKISPIALASQRPVVNAMSSVVNSSREIVNSASQLCANPNDSASSQLIAVHSKTLGDALRNLAGAIKNGAPGQREIDDSIAAITALGAEIDGSLVQATVGSLSSKGASGDYESLKDSLLNNISAVSSNVDVVHNAAKNDAEMLGPAVVQMASNLALVRSQFSLLCSCNLTQIFFFSATPYHSS
jgi:talin